MELSSNSVKPLSLWKSILIGAIIAGIALVCFYFLRPLLEKAGLNEYAAYLISLSLGLIVILIWAVLSFLSEENDRTFKAFLIRVRLNHLIPKWFYWAFGLAIIMFLSTVILSPVLSWLISHNIIPLPQDVPDYINPSKQLSIDKVKEQLINQGVIPLIPIVLLINIFSEEIFWRGIILPRQELQHGKNAFWIHGITWGFTHLFQFWLLLPILIGSIALAYVIQRTKCTWISIVAHLLNNGLPFLIMALA
jgi:membrane protease YdiL (CAAX protease family)